MSIPMITAALYFSTLAALPLRPQDGAARLEAGLAAYKGGEYAKAIELLAPLTGQAGADSTYRDAIPALGMSYYFRNECVKALPLLEKASSWWPHNMELAYPLGLCYVRRADASGARRAFARMFRMEPDSGGARVVTAQFMIREEQQALAQAELEQALRQAPNQPMAHFLSGELAIFRGDADAAILELQKEIALNPAFAMSYYRLGDAYSRKEMWDEAVASLQKAIWLNPDFSSPYILLGKVYHRKRELRLAEGVLKHAVSMDPNNASAHYLLGMVYRESGREADAKREFDLYRQRREQ